MRRRLACALYECVLVFGVVFTVGLIYGVLVKQTHGLHHRMGLQLSLVFFLGLYFVIPWVKTGQTLAMKTWNIFVLRAPNQTSGAAFDATININHMQKMSYPQAIFRYLSIHMAYLPSVLTAKMLHLPAFYEAMVLLIGVLVYFCLYLVLPRRQALHDQYTHTGLYMFSRISTK